jgi:DNA-binding NarL/FixJ family response regulator
MRILIVDDMAAVREGLRTLLGDEPGVEVVGEASDGEQAVRLVNDLRPDVVLMDIEMPGVGGLQATRTIKNRPQPPLVIVMSLYGGEAESARAREAGADRFVTKSALLAEVVGALRAAFKVVGASAEPNT